MGEPIKVMIGAEEITVYGQAQLAVHVSEGKQLADEATATPPATITKKAPRKRKPRINKAN